MARPSAPAPSGGTATAKTFEDALSKSVNELAGKTAVL